LLEVSQAKMWIFPQKDEATITVEICHPFLWKSKKKVFISFFVQYLCLNFFRGSKSAGREISKPKPKKKCLNV
jgi:hypothetical protein